MSMIDAIKQTATGLQVLSDWLGAGLTPVPIHLANERAQSCVGCEKNCAPRWWEHTKGAIADAIKEQMEAKAGMKITTPFESALHMCRTCGCCLPLKIHVPIEHIKSHTTPETLEKFPTHCWILHELNP